ncbi:hypothetical protein [Telmatospirillum sp. J64-1]|uniref:hypothetical protein n=1 Tax=Telmatospirillum sp. J64-1 TaxID=2502183 RepID=UPI00115CDB84|nr:hypothetical protein [Telmatospirillum sp. J64-1]
MRFEAVQAVAQGCKSTRLAESFGAELADTLWRIGEGECSLDVVEPGSSHEAAAKNPPFLQPMKEASNG